MWHLGGVVLLVCQLRCTTEGGGEVVQMGRATHPAMSDEHQSGKMLVSGSTVQSERVVFGQACSAAKKTQGSVDTEGRST